MTEKDTLEVRIEFIKTEIHLLDQLIETNQNTYRDIIECSHTGIESPDDARFYAGKILAYQNVMSHLYDLLYLYYSLKGEQFNGNIEVH